jgi:hypothetical protein
MEQKQKPRKLSKEELAELKKKYGNIYCKKLENGE